MERIKTRKLFSFYRILSIILVTVILVMSVTACSSKKVNESSSATAASNQTQQNATTGAVSTWKGDPNLNALGQTPICKEKVTLKVGTKQNTQVQDFNTNTQTLMLEKQGNFDLVFDVYPSQNFDQKVELMVMSGGSDLPDVLMSAFKDAQVNSYGKMGAILPLKQYYKNSSYYIKEGLAQVKEDVLKYITSPEGDIYGVLAYNQSIFNENPNKIWVYQPWLTKLGISAPKTTDEYAAMLKAFKEKDPNGNGKADEIPLAGWMINPEDRCIFEGLMTPFAYASGPDYWLVENGKVNVAYVTEGWKQGLKYIRGLVKDNLLTPLTFTQDKQQFTAMISADPEIVGSNIWMAPSYLGAKDAKRPEYIGIAPLTGPSGQKYTVTAPSMPYVSMVITKNCKTPEAAFRLGDLMCSREMSIHTRWGEKGVDWLEPAASEKSICDALGYKPVLKPVLAWGIAQNKLLAQAGPYFRTYDIAAGQVWSGDPADTSYMASKILKEYLDKAPKEIIPKLIYTTEEEEEIRELLNTINNYVKESSARFALGDLDIDKDWSNYTKELEKMKLSRILQIVQKVYDRMYKK